jgi:hypothetical protein
MYAPSSPVSLPYAHDALLAAVGDHIGGAGGQYCLVMVHQDDPLDAEPLRGEYYGQPGRECVVGDRRVYGSAELRPTVNGPS